MNYNLQKRNFNHIFLYIFVLDLAAETVTEDGLGLGHPSVIVMVATQDRGPRGHQVEVTGGQDRGREKEEIEIQDRQLTKEC